MQMSKTKLYIILASAAIIVVAIILIFALSSNQSPISQEEPPFKTTEEDENLDVLSKEVNEFFNQENLLQDLQNNLSENQADQLPPLPPTAPIPQNQGDASPKSQNNLFDLEAIEREQQSAQANKELDSFLGDDALLREINY